MEQSLVMVTQGQSRCATFIPEDGLMLELSEKIATRAL